jgi:hypothetical protein
VCISDARIENAEREKEKGKKKLQAAARISRSFRVVSSLGQRGHAGGYKVRLRQAETTRPKSEGSGAGSGLQ